MLTENIWELLEKFLKEKSEEKQLFYIWGHSYEFDVNNNWKRMEEILDRLMDIIISFMEQTGKCFFPVNRKQKSD